MFYIFALPLYLPTYSTMDHIDTKLTTAHDKSFPFYQCRTSSRSPQTETEARTGKDQNKDLY